MLRTPHVKATHCRSSMGASHEAECMARAGTLQYNIPWSDPLGMSVWNTHLKEARTMWGMVQTSLTLPAP